MEKGPVFLDPPRARDEEERGQEANLQDDGSPSSNETTSYETNTSVTAGGGRDGEESDEQKQQQLKEKRRVELSPAPAIGTSTATSHRNGGAAGAGSRPTSSRRAGSTMSKTLSRVRSRGDEAEAAMNFSHPLERVKTGKEVLVNFDGPDDPYKALNWSSKKKWISVALYGATTGSVTFDSSVFSAAINPITEEYGVGREVATLGLSLMLLGFGLGPLLWGPMSELYGRKVAVLTPFAISMIFTFACGAGDNIQTILICRFFAGVFGSAPITNTGGFLGDVFSPATRGKALVIYAMAVVGGPTLGPIVGSALIQTGNSWRWTEYVTGIFKAVVLLLDVLIIDESYSPTLLKYKARHLRVTTGNWALHSKEEEFEYTLRQMADKYLRRPFQLLGTPICALIATYASFVYGLLYSLLEAIPIEFEEVRGWNTLVGSLPFLAVLVGIFIAAGGNMINQKYYLRAIAANGGRAVPEARLPPMMVGSVLLSAGLWLFAWTSGPNISWVAPAIACALFGCGFFAIFQSALNYLIDTFQTWGASAIAANTFLRSVFAAAFPLFIRQVLTALNVDVGISIFAAVSVVMIPIPFLFYIYGRRIRARGKWSAASL